MFSKLVYSKGSVVDSFKEREDPMWKSKTQVSDFFPSENAKPWTAQNQIIFDY